MIGVYDYTVVLTYLSMVSGVIGIIFTVTGIGHPEIGIFFLMASGILDGFDGKVARTKKNRSEFEKNFGVQIDSLSDLICFGVLPASIGLAQLRLSGRFTEIVAKKDYEGCFAVLIMLLVIAVFYVLAALIRLAYYNATIDIRMKEAEETGITYFVGLPVTSAALIFPLEMMVQMFCKHDLTVIYFILMLLVAIAFVMNIKIKKPGKVGFIVIMIVGVIEFAANIAAFLY